jgi:hypothetical protein
MAYGLRGRRITIEPLKGESEFEREQEGRIEGIVQRPGVKRQWEYYLVRLDETLAYLHPSFERPLRLTHVLILPDGTRLEWAYTGGGPPGLPVLIKVFGVLPEPNSKVTDYATGSVFLLARAIAKSGRNHTAPEG